ncbi:MAG: CCA tRNA nucleotidyltransferase [Pseudomonadota bacterium]
MTETPRLAIDPSWETERRLGRDLLDRPGLTDVMDALDGEAVLVGGAVRDSLMGRPAGDVDLSTPLTPETVRARLTKAGLKAIPTGIEHGTVTAVAQHAAFEITTFRADVQTDGRRATVAFSTDMAADAERRDFTMNALYATQDGRVLDPLGGLADLAARRVRFIGSPEARIREDYLRILRFFRFTAWHACAGEDGIDAEGLAACAALGAGVERLARERIGHEMRRLLAAPDPATATAAMAASGVLARCLPGANAAVLAPLVHVERALGRAPDWRLRLVAMGGEDASASLRLSRAEARTLETWMAAVAKGASPAATAWRHGAEAGWAALILGVVAGQPLPERDAAQRLIADAATAEIPIAAADLVASGIRPGPKLGEALAAAERAWIESGFALDKSALLTEFGGRSAG